MILEVSQFCKSQFEIKVFQIFFKPLNLSQRKSFIPHLYTEDVPSASSSNASIVFRAFWLVRIVQVVSYNLNACIARPMNQGVKVFMQLLMQNKIVLVKDCIVEWRKMNEKKNCPQFEEHGFLKCIVLFAHGWYFLMLNVTIIIYVVCLL